MSAKERILPGADYLRSYKPTEQGSEQGVTVWIVTIVLRKYNKTICECYIKLANGSKGFFQGDYSMT